MQGKAILEQFDVDVQSSGFPNAPAKIIDYVEQRYLSRVRPQNIRNFGLVLAKSILKDVPPSWERHRRKTIASLIAIRERASGFWPDISAAIVRLINGIEPENRIRAVAFLAAFPDFWSPLATATKTALQETVANIDAATLTDFRVLGAVRLPDFRQSLLEVIDCFGTKQLRKAISDEPLPELWPEAIETYESSASYRGSEANFDDFILPFSGRLTSEQHDMLLSAIVENGQNWDAAETPSLLFLVLKNSAVDSFPSKKARDRFYQALRRIGGRDRYKDVIELFQFNDWTPPPAEQSPN